MTSFFEFSFSRSSSWLTSELFPTVITTGLELIRHLFNFLRYFKYHLPKSKLTSPNESASLLTETKARSNYDVIEGNEAIWCWCYWSAGCYGGKLSIMTNNPNSLSWSSSSVISFLLDFINEIKMTDLNFLICFPAWHFRHGCRSNSDRTRQKWTK